jgi:CBS domain-containing protein
MHTVKQLLGRKGPEVYSVAPDAPVIEAIRVMARHSIGSVLVMDGRRLAGILSERDYARKIVLRDLSSSTTPVREIMTERVVTVDSSHDLGHCMRLMTEHRIRHLPVMAGEAVIGVVSIGDVVKALVEEQQVELDQLHRYIAS